ncbi:MAG: binding-protein-dependent transporter inner membrane component [Acidobacteria bacterium OLB17]|nr:MAG: binding-protein-dependent transporter inner membrane component [Acidobacteria bacterium OLB17]
MNRLFYIGAFIAVTFILVAIFAHWIAPYDGTVPDLLTRYAAPSSAHWFGTDALGRDVFSRVVFGARISLEVGISVVAVSSVIGILIGAFAGYFGGVIDKILSGYVFNVFLAFPGLLLAIALVAFFRCRAWEAYPRTLRDRLGRLRTRNARAGAQGAGTRLRSGSEGSRCFEHADHLHTHSS